MEYFIDRESIHSSTFSSTDIQQSIVRVYLPSSTGSEYCTANSHLLWLLLIPIWKYIWWFSTNIQTKGWIVLLKCNWIGVSKQTSLLPFFKITEQSFQIAIARQIRPTATSNARRAATSRARLAIWSAIPDSFRLRGPRWRAPRPKPVSTGACFSQSSGTIL